MDNALWIPLLLSLKLAVSTVVILLLFGLPLAWQLAKYQGQLKPLFEALVALPLVMPPTVLGYYLLVAFAPDTALGGLWTSLTGQQLAFSFSGILLGSIFYSMPFVIQPLLNSFQQVGLHYDKVVSSLGVSRTKRFVFFILPLCKPALITATTLGFAHTLGEFGLILMIGGNIPGETKVVSIELYNQVELMNYGQANTIALVLIGVSLLSLILLYRSNHRVGMFKL